jgi:hypothetical protein
MNQGGAATTRRLDEFRDTYVAALDAYLAAGEASTLRAAFELGQVAVAKELDVLELAAVHNEALARGLGSVADVQAAEPLARAAGSFFLESLSAFEIVRRVLRDAHEDTLLEKRQAATLRQLSRFLADAALALEATGSFQEMLQLIAEDALELIRAGWCSARLALDGGEGEKLEAIACSHGNPDAAHVIDADSFAAIYKAIRPRGGALRMSSGEIADLPAHRALTQTGEVGAPRQGWLAAPLAAVGGHRLGMIQLFDKDDGEFSELDEATLVQLAQMAAAVVERARP